MNVSLLRTDEEFIEIYNRNFNTVYQICYLLLKNASDAEDITQNTFTKLYKINPSFNDKNHERAWLILTAKNMCYNNLKHWWHKVTEIVIEPTYEQTDDETLNSLLRLDDKYKTVIYMHYYMGYKTTEIAKMLKKNESTIRSLLKRGKNLLKIQIEEGK